MTSGNQSIDTTMSHRRGDRSDDSSCSDDDDSKGVRDVPNALCYDVDDDAAVAENAVEAPLGVADGDATGRSHDGGNGQNKDTGTDRKDSRSNNNNRLDTCDARSERDRGSSRGDGRDDRCNHRWQDRGRGRRDSRDFRRDERNRQNNRFNDWKDRGHRDDRRPRPFRDEGQSRQSGSGGDLGPGGFMGMGRLEDGGGSPGGDGHNRRRSRSPRDQRRNKRQRTTEPVDNHEPCAIRATGVPRNINVGTLMNHFSRFGPVAKFENDRGEAFVQYRHHQAALRCMRNHRPVCGNRYIRLHWAESHADQRDGGHGRGGASHRRQDEGMDSSGDYNNSYNNDNDNSYNDDNGGEDEQQTASGSQKTDNLVAEARLQSGLTVLQSNLRRKKVLLLQKQLGQHKKMLEQLQSMKGTSAEKMQDAIKAKVQQAETALAALTEVEEQAAVPVVSAADAARRQLDLELEQIGVAKKSESCAAEKSTSNNDNGEGYDNDNDASNKDSNDNNDIVCSVTADHTRGSQHYKRSYGGYRGRGRGRRGRGRSRRW